ncbi:MAG: hypothetical protein ACP5OZ_03775 [Candidatus Woesearchaeota archaeon]
MKKAQAAMEFLMTYGWAILIVIAAAAALAYFGVFRAGRNVPTICDLGTGFSCNVKLTSDGTATIIITNGLGMSVNDVVLTIENPCTPTSVDITDGNSQTFTCNVTSGTAGTKYKHNLQFFYIEENGLNHTRLGNLVAQYE